MTAVMERVICTKCRYPAPRQFRRATDEMSVAARRMETFDRVGNDRSYPGIALIAGLIEA